MAQIPLQTDSAIRTLHQRRERARQRAIISYLLFMPFAAYTLTYLVLLWIPESMLSTFAQTVIARPLLWSVTAILSALTLAGGIVEASRADKLVFHKDSQQTAALRDLCQIPHMNILIVRLMRHQGGIFEFQVRELQRISTGINPGENPAGLPIEPDTQSQP